MTSEDIERAKRIVASWLWQPAEGQLYRYKYAISTYTRFCEAPSLQPDEIKLVIDYLQSGYEEAKVGLLGKEYDFGGKWVAKSAWLQTMPGEKWNGTESTRVRIYQILVKPNEEGKTGDGPYAVEKGCQYKVEHTFFWNVPEIPKVPDSKSGIEYRLLSVNRNDETGFFTAVLEKRERVQQDVAEYGTEETAFVKKKEEQHIGVRQEMVTSTGKVASVKGGKRVTRQIRKNPDCTSDVVNETTEENPVKGAVVRYRKTLRGVSKSVTDRSQPAQLTGNGLKVGEERTSELTEGQLWNNTVTTTDVEGAGEIGEECTKSQGEHTHVNTENVEKKPTVEVAAAAVNVEERVQARRTEENTWDVTRSRVVYTPKTTGEIVGGSALRRETREVGVDQPKMPAGRQGGVNEEIRVSGTPNNHGSFSTEVSRIVYTPKSIQLMTGTVSQIETVEEGINQPTVTVPSPGVNESVSANIGINDHGSLTTNVRKIKYIPALRTATGGTTSATETVETGVNQTTVPTGTVGVNKRVDVSVSMNDHGSMTTQKRTITYSGGGTSINWNDDRGSHTYEAYRNSTTPKKPSGSKGRSSCSFSVNDHGSYDGSVYTFTEPPDTGGETLDYSYGPIECTSKIYYMNKGKMYERKITAKREVFYGKLKSVLKKIANGESCALAGFVTGYAAKGVDMATGVKYTNVEIGKEKKVDD